MSKPTVHMEWCDGERTMSKKSKLAKLTAAWRDASWYPCPGEAGVFHIAIEKDGVLYPACNTTLMRFGHNKGHKGAVLNESTQVPAANVRHNRCERPGCRNRWPRRQKVVLF